MNAPHTIWASTPATSPSDNHSRSRRRGTRMMLPATASITATDTTPVNNRFKNSIMPWTLSSSGENWPCSHWGQSVQPRPDPVSRTAAPVTTITARATRAATVTTR